MKQYRTVRAFKVEDAKAETLMPIIKQFCSEEAQFFTDELSSYACLDREGMKHGVIRHGEKEYSTGRATTNSIEGFWAHFKRMVFGTYHVVSPAYLQRYIDEAVFRYNTRKMGEGKRLAEMLGRAMRVVEYEDVKTKKVA